MSNRAWMPLHIADYLADTGHLTATEHGAYLLLIMHYWQHGSLPAEERMIGRIAKMDAAQWAESRDVLAMLFGPGWKHKRIDAELLKADEIIEKRRSAALGRHLKSKASANAVHVDSKSGDTGASPLTGNQVNVGADAPTSPEAAKAAPVASSPTAIELPCVSGEPFPISEADVAEWRAAFPAVDIRQQLSAARQWLIANPTRGKTKRGMRKFVVSWLDRRQNDAGRNAPPRQSTSPPRKPNVVDAYHSIAREKGWISDEPEFVPSADDDAQRLSAVGGGPSGTVVDLRPGAFRRIRSSDM